MELFALLGIQVLAADQPLETDPPLLSDGNGWKLNQATVKDSKHPRVLLKGGIEKEESKKPVLFAVFFAF